MIRATIHVPQEYVGPIVQLCQERRGTQRDINYGTQGRVQVEYELPLSEVVFGFYDRLKTLSRGYASLDYEPSAYQESELVRLDLLVNGDKVDALSIVCHKAVAYNRGHDLCVKMKEVIPRQMFEVAIQAAIGSKIITRVSVRALRKDVTSKCYGGDITRKRKLLEKQKKGKRRMKAVGNVELPQEAFLAVLKVD
jgi:GTP-binding protein LepA